jgi:hypothetical protein
MLHKIRPQRLSNIKHSSLLVRFISYKENEELEIPAQEPKFYGKTSNLLLLLLLMMLMLLPIFIMLLQILLLLLLMQLLLTKQWQL